VGFELRPQYLSRGRQVMTIGIGKNVICGENKRGIKEK
jgi:hypothetical protein